MILSDESLRQAKADGTPFVQIAQRAGVLVGIKVDAGAKDFALHPGEKVTEGLARCAALCQQPAECHASSRHFARPGRHCRAWSAARALDPVVPIRPRTLQLRGLGRRIQHRHGEALT